MLLGMSQSPRGALCTMHAMSTDMAIERLINYTMMAGPSITAPLATRMIAGAVNLFVQITPVAGGRRVVSSVREIAGLEGDRILTNEIFAANGDRPARPHHSLHATTRSRLVDAGFDVTSLNGWAIR